MGKFKDRAQSVLEYIISGVFVLGGISLIGQPALEGAGFVVMVFGGQFAIYFYIFWFIFLGLGLVYAKIRKRKRLHKNMLLCMYLTTIYTAVLGGYIYGFGLDLIDDIIIGVLTAIFWVRWKFKTEYLDPDEFQEFVNSERKKP